MKATMPPLVVSLFGASAHASDQPPFAERYGNYGNVAAPCIAETAGSSGLPALAQLPPGDYFFIVKWVGANLCGTFELNPFVPLV